MICNYKEGLVEKRGNFKTYLPLVEKGSFFCVWLEGMGFVYRVR